MSRIYTCKKCGYTGANWRIDPMSNTAQCPNCGWIYTVMGKCPNCGNVGIFSVPWEEKLIPPLHFFRIITGKRKAVCKKCHKRVDYVDIEPVLI